MSCRYLYDLIFTFTILHPASIVSLKTVHTRISQLYLHRKAHCMVNSYELLVIRNKCSIYVENFATRDINVLFKSRAIQSMTKGILPYHPIQAHAMVVFPKSNDYLLYQNNPS